MLLPWVGWFVGAAAADVFRGHFAFFSHLHLLRTPIPPHHRQASTTVRRHAVNSVRGEQESQEGAIYLGGDSKMRPATLSQLLRW